MEQIEHHHEAVESHGMPHNDRAEQVLLGAVLLDSGNIPQVMDKVKVEDFYRQRHQVIYRTVISMFESDQEVDTVLVCDELIKLGTLHEAGGEEYVDSLIEGIPRTANLGYYAGVVKEKSMLRNLAKFGQELIKNAMETENTAMEVLSSAETGLFDLREGEATHGFKQLTNLLDESYAIIQERASNDGGLVGLNTGFIDYDRVTNGLQKGDLIIVAARPAMGKTSFCLNIAMNSALKANANVAIYSLEMPAHQLAMRLIGSEARVSISSLRSGQLRDDEWNRVANGVAALGEANIYIDDSGDATVAKMRADLKRLDADIGVDLVVIDYLQLMSGSTLNAQQSRVQEVSAISRGLKILAKEVNAPVIALSQLSRAAEQRTDKRPMLSDLRESGSIEQDADMVCFLYREDYYSEKSTSDTPQDAPDEEFGIAELIIAKHRNGPTGKVNLAFFKKYTRFENYSDDIEFGG